MPTPSPLAGIPLFWRIQFMFWLVLTLFGIAARSEWERAATAEAARLRLQLDPHLISNALNGIATKIPECPEVAVQMLHDVTDDLRMSLQNAKHPICPLPEEVAVVQAFLALQKAPFSAGLAWDLQIRPAALGFEVPTFVLQLLVENAVKHGWRERGQLLRLGVCAWAEDNRLFVRFRNNGRLRPDRQDVASLGIGMANLRQRLQLHYPRRPRFTLFQQADEVVADLALGGTACFGSC